MSDLVDIGTEAIGVAVAQHIRVVSGPGHVHLACKVLPGAGVSIHGSTCTSSAQPEQLIGLARHKVALMATPSLKLPWKGSLSHPDRQGCTMHDKEIQQGS